MMPLPYRAILKTQALALAAVLLVAFSPAAHAKDAPAVTIGEMRTIKAKDKDTLSDLAVEYQIGYAQLVAANPTVDPWLPGKGTEIIIPDWHILPEATREGIVLNTSELRLYYFPADGSAPRTFPIGIGRQGLYTPKGTTTVVSKRANPTWSPTPRMRQEDPRLPVTVPAGPDNPLGLHAMYLGWPSYRIHGTNHEKGVGRRASSGCIRMYKDEIKWLFSQVTPGTKVTSIEEPIKIAWIGDDLFIEAEPNNIQIDEIEYKNRQVTVEIPEGTIERVRTKAGKKVDRVNWEKVRDVLITRSGIPTKVTN
jgi:L,D-transpeptidase ErfK/SrfK